MKGGLALYAVTCRSEGGRECLDPVRPGAGNRLDTRWVYLVRGNNFTDINSGEYFYEHVLDLRDAQAITGYADSTFRPYNQATRAQLVKIVVLAFHIPLYTGTEQPFSDVPTSHPFYQYIMTARRDSIITGYNDGTFRPYANVTRGQISKIVNLATHPDTQR